jgi:hypothetical protein
MSSRFSFLMACINFLNVLGWGSLFLGYLWVGGPWMSAGFVFALQSFSLAVLLSRPKRGPQNDGSKPLKPRDQAPGYFLSGKDLL